MPRPALSDFLSDDELRDLYRPAGEAIGLPGKCYGAEFFALEQTRLFKRRWCPVGFAGDIPEPGDAKPVDLAGWPLLLLRGTDGAVRAFHNVCRHRNNIVVDAPCRGLKRIVCPWHSWSYDLDGRLIATPRLGGQRKNADPAFDAADVDLKPVATAEWLGFVFVNIDGAAPPFEEHIRPLAELYRDYELDDLRPDAGWDMEFPCNWKVVVEGAIEDYHLPYVHGQMVRGEVEARPRLDHAPGCFFASSSARKYRAGDDAGEATARHSPLPRILGAPPEVEQRTFVTSVFPTGFATTRPNYIWIWLILPDGPGRTRVETRALFKGDAGTDPAFAELRRALDDEWRLVLDQDLTLTENVQRNMDRPDDAGIRPRFSPYWEANIQRFQQSIVEAVGPA